MSSHQFPPSSPLHGDSHREYDVFAATTSKEHDAYRGRPTTHYPTPNPSSATGRSSSPVREVTRHDVDIAAAPVPAPKSATGPVSNSLEKVASARSKPKHQVRINRDFNILDPDHDVLRIPLAPVPVQGARGPTILVGRSSKQCDFYFKSSDKTISRTHLAIHSEFDHIVVECLGFGGFAMRIPCACLVYGTSQANDYVLMEARGDQQALSINDLRGLGLKVTPRTISLDANHTEFFVNRNERVTLPRIDNIIIQVRDNVLLLNAKDVEEDVTDEETPVLMKPSVVLDKVVPVEVAPGKLSAEAESIAFSTPTKSVIIHNNGPRFLTPMQQPSVAAFPTTPAKVNFRATSEEPTPSYSILDESDVKFRVYSDNESEHAATPLTRNPLQNITNTDTSNSNPSKKQKSNPRRPEEVVDQSCVASINNIAEINNVLLNHLAFSRLSSTPASFLNTISALTSNLSLKQMRVILYNLKAVGVIYREGKDAAGKPLEEEYYYKPEEDDDMERPKLVASIKGHGGLRSCRRTHKQYYWKKPASKKK
ncbi:FHA domain-containing protein [[Candida] zeylanoides]